MISSGQELAARAQFHLTLAAASRFRLGLSLLGVMVSPSPGIFFAYANIEGRFVYPANRPVDVANPIVGLAR
jgi:hypothetical protein